MTKMGGHEWRTFSVEIDEESCKGCLICVYICSKRGSEVLRESGEKTALGGALPAVVGDCIGCRWCERFCPDFAITVEEGPAC
ncbi:MAG: 4Fe-4S binding protein [Candidatus Bathyarchaeia archaeon]